MLAARWCPQKDLQVALLFSQSQALWARLHTLLSSQKVQLQEDLPLFRVRLLSCAFFETLALHLHVSWPPAQACAELDRNPFFVYAPFASDLVPSAPSTSLHPCHPHIRRSCWSRLLSFERMVSPSSSPHATALRNAGRQMDMTHVSSIVIWDEGTARPSSPPRHGGYLRTESWRIGRKVVVVARRWKMGLGVADGCRLFSACYLACTNEVNLHRFDWVQEWVHWRSSPGPAPLVVGHLHAFVWTFA